MADRTLFPDLSSRLPGFYELPLSERRMIAAKFAGEEDTIRFGEKCNLGGLTAELTDTFIENAIGGFSLPLGVATNFLINDEDILVPMAVEETSVLAAASHGAKLVRAGSGFKTSSTPPIMTAQIQLEIPGKNISEYEAKLNQYKPNILEYANRGHKRLLSRGGGAIDLTWRHIPEIQSLILHLDVNTGDAMGANIVNTMAEKVATLIPSLFSCEVGLCILTNLSVKRLAKAECWIPAKVFDRPEMDGADVIERIHRAYLFAYHDIYRATTHNKGVMNGVDPVLIATGNDWRAVEAGAHAWAARSGRYLPLTNWSITEDRHLYGCLEMPMAVGTVGGVTKLHPTAQMALKLMGSPNARKLAEIICSVGLAQNLSALRALSSEGIQHGHMHLHQKNIDLLERQIRQGATSQ